MINTLTPEQEKLLIVYRDKWLKIGISTNRVSLSVGKHISDYYYKKLAEKPIVPVVIMSSPFYAWYAVCLMNQKDVRNQVWNQVENQVWNQVENQVWNQVWNQVRNQVQNQVENQVENQVRNQVQNQVENQVGNQVWNQVENQVGNFIYPYLNGHFMSSYFSFYNFINEVLKIEFECQEKYDWYQSTSQVGLIYPLENICIISDLPEKINMRNGLLHSDGSPAIKYTDGFSVWALNGVNVSKEIAETPAQDLKSKLLLETTNAQVRSEIIKKIGYSRILKDLKAKNIDSWREYELYRIDEGDVEPMVLLKYACPSTGAYYAHRVPPNITKAREAMTWANHEVDPQEFLVET